MDEDRTNIFLSLFLTCFIFILYAFYAFSELCIICILLIVLYSTCFTKKMDWMTGNIFQKTANSSNTCVEKQQNFLVANSSYNFCAQTCARNTYSLYILYYSIYNFIYRKAAHMCPHFPLHILLLLIY